MGVHCTVHRNREKVVVFSDDGSDCTRRLPSVVKEILALAEKELILDVVLEMWREGRYLGREIVSGYLHEKGEADDSETIATVFGVLWYPSVGDIHEKSELERLEFLEKLDIPQRAVGKPLSDRHLQKVSYDICRTPEKLKAALTKYSGAEGSEGAIIKLGSSDYSLAGDSTRIINFKNYAPIKAIVWRINRTSIPTQFNYDFALDFETSDNVKPESVVEINGRKYTQAGRTYNTTEQCAMGDVIRLKFHTMNLSKDSHTGFNTIHLYEPVFDGKIEDEKRPDTFQSAIRIGESSGLLERKTEKSFFHLEEVQKANYPGGKLRFANKILAHVPEGEGALMFDPMAGCGGVLVAAVEMGYRVWANELAVTPLLYCKGIFEGRPVTEGELEALCSADPVEGFMTNNLDIFGYPTNKNHRRYIDGMVMMARRSRPPLRWAYLSILSNLMMMWRGSFDSKWHKFSGHHGIGDQKRTRNQIKYAFNRFNEICEKVRGKGKVTGLDAFTMDIPEAAVIYYDPPYFDSEKKPIGTYSSLNWRSDCLLAQERIEKRPEMKFDESVELIKKLAVKAPVVLISQPQRAKDFRPSLQGYYTRLTVRGFKLPSAGGGFQNESKIKANRGERLYIMDTRVARSVSKAVSPFMEAPPQDSTHRFVVQHHSYGKSVHADLRMQSGQRNQYLIGYTLNDQMPGVIKEPLLTLEQARQMERQASKYFKINWNNFEWKKRKRGTKQVNVEIVTERKTPKMSSRWLTFQGVIPAKKGATREKYPNVFLIVAKGTIEFGALKPWVSEYFLKASTGTGWYSRLVFRQLKNIWREKGADEKVLDKRDETPYDINEIFDEIPSDEMIKAVIPVGEGGFGTGEKGWVAIKPVDQTPYVLSSRAINKDWIPSLGQSALPKFMRSAIPVSLRYWTQSSRAEALEVRNELVHQMKTGTVDLPMTPGKQGA